MPRAATTQLLFYLTTWSLFDWFCSNVEASVGLVPKSDLLFIGLELIHCEHWKKLLHGPTLKNMSTYNSVHTLTWDFKCRNKLFNMTILSKATPLWNKDRISLGSIPKLNLVRPQSAWGCSQTSRLRLLFDKVVLPALVLVFNTYGGEIFLVYKITHTIK